MSADDYSPPTSRNPVHVASVLLSAHASTVVLGRMVDDIYAGNVSRPHALAELARHAQVLRSDIVAMTDETARESALELLAEMESNILRVIDVYASRL